MSAVCRLWWMSSTLALMLPCCHATLLVVVECSNPSDLSCIICNQATLKTPSNTYYISSFHWLHWQPQPGWVRRKSKSQVCNLLSAEYTYPEIFNVNLLLRPRYVVRIILTPDDRSVFSWQPATSATAGFGGNLFWNCDFLWGLYWKHSQQAHSFRFPV